MGFISAINIVNYLLMRNEEPVEKIDLSLPKEEVPVTKNITLDLHKGQLLNLSKNCNLTKLRLAAGWDYDNTIVMKNIEY